MKDANRNLSLAEYVVTLIQVKSTNITYKWNIWKKSWLYYFLSKKYDFKYDDGHFVYLNNTIHHIDLGGFVLILIQH